LDHGVENLGETHDQKEEAHIGNGDEEEVEAVVTEHDGALNRSQREAVETVEMEGHDACHQDDDDDAEDDLETFHVDARRKVDDVDEGRWFPCETSHHDRLR
jgi:hypothetical protein